MIRVLDKAIADKIAAGEVIERPVSIVKELVENALDAGASSVTVEIKNGGKSYIRVTDNGIGIAREEAATAFLRHATSKISSVKDLDAIETLGFRGEALASIAAVTSCELITKTADTKAGTRILLRGGIPVRNEQTGCPDGTTFIITDLFFNTPARLKFMKSDGAESGMIIDFVSQVALAYKEIKFCLINNGRILFTTPGDGNRLNTIIRIYHDVDAKNMVPVSHSEEGLSLEGYISTPAMSRTSRGSQIFFVNGRVVNSKVMEKGVSLGYKERLFEGRYPVVYLFLRVDPGTIDVNIHPNKREVRFDDEALISDFISRGIKAALATKEAVVDAGNLFKPEKKDVVCQNIFADHSNREESTVREQVDIKTLLSTIKKEPSPEPAKEEFVKVEIPETGAPSEEKIEIDAPLIKPFDITEIKVTGVLFDTYITAVDDDNFYLIDQHAAHEKVYYERFVKRFREQTVESQYLSPPLIVSLNLQEEALLKANRKYFEDFGFEIEPFGGKEYCINAVPANLYGLTEEELFLEMLDNLASEKDKDPLGIFASRLATMACKAAVKGNHQMSDREANALIDELLTLENPYHCPHGRPTIISMTKTELEKKFKRIV